MKERSTSFGRLRPPEGMVIMARGLARLLAPALLLGVVLTTAMAQPPEAGSVVYEAHLSCCDIATGRETLAAVVSSAAGSRAWVQAYVEGNDLVLYGTYSGLSSPIRTDLAEGVHLHHDPGMYHLDTLIRGLQSTWGTEGTFQGRVALTPEYRTMLELQRMYVDIHTTDYPEGEIHGMLRPVHAGNRAW
jgi:hypothetical protein